MGINYLAEATKLEHKVAIQTERLNATLAFIQTLENTPQATDKIMRPLRAKLNRQREALDTTMITLGIVKGLDQHAADKQAIKDGQDLGPKLGKSR